MSLSVVFVCEISGQFFKAELRSFHFAGIKIISVCSWLLVASGFGLQQALGLVSDGVLAGNGVNTISEVIGNRSPNWELVAAPQWKGLSMLWSWDLQSDGCSSYNHSSIVLDRCRENRAEPERRKEEREKISTKTKVSPWAHSPTNIKINHVQIRRRSL